MQYRYRRGEMIELYRYTQKLTRAPPGNSIDLLDTNTRGHAFKLTKPRKTFPHRAIEEWNKLPDEVVQAPSVNAFKGRHWQREHYAYTSNDT
jgi:hypothetical protein